MGITASGGRFTSASDRVARMASSTGFLVWAVACNAVVVGGVTELTWGRGAAAQIAIAAFALLAGVGAMFALPFLLVWAIATPPAAAASHPPLEVQPAAQPQPVSARPPDDSRRELLETLERGRALPPDDEPGIEAWIASTRVLLEERFPGFVGYYARPAEGDAATRLRAYVSRLATIVHDSL